MLHLVITKSTTTVHPYILKKKNVTKKNNITHPLKMLHLAITKSTTTAHPYILQKKRY